MRRGVYTVNMSGTLGAASIADAAIALADAEGVGAVSMRRVGANLGVSGMALYRHVGDREDLVRQMVARVAGELPPVPEGEAGWQDTLRRLATTVWVAFERHRWLADVAVSPTRLVDATSARATETVLARLVAAGLSPERAGDVFLGTAALVIGVARVTLGPAGDRPVEYAIDGAADGAAEGRPASSPRAAELADAFRNQPLDAARGRRLLDTTLDAYLSGVAASLDPEPGGSRAGSRKDLT